MINIFKIINTCISFYSPNTHLLTPKPKSSFRHLKRGIQGFHMNYVLVPADIAANNVVIVWQLYDALISKGSFMQTKYLCFWSTSELRVRLALWNWFKPSSKIFYWSFQGCTSFMDLSCFFCLVFAMPLCASVYMCLVVTCWERADLLALICGVYLWVCHFLIGILGQVWYLSASTPDLCTLTYFSVENIIILSLITIIPIIYICFGYQMWLNICIGKSL